jgi:hypothetical protein
VWGGDECRAREKSDDKHAAYGFEAGHDARGHNDEKRALECSWRDATKACEFAVK